MMLSDQELLAAVKEQTSEAFVIYGELGGEKLTGLALLALERETGALVVLIVSVGTGPDGEIELGVEVCTELEASIPALGTMCVSCGDRLRPAGLFCPNCGAEVAGPSGAAEADLDEMRAAVVGSITEDYELLGELLRKEGGRVYFAREKASGAIAALRLNKGTADGEFELVETQAI